jgi:hypothetical protein
MNITPDRLYHSGPMLFAAECPKPPPWGILRKFRKLTKLFRRGYCSGDIPFSEAYQTRFESLLN